MTVVFVAAPPGWKDWLSARAHDALASCEAVVHASGVDPDVLDLAASATRCEGDAARAIELAREGRSVVRLTQVEALDEVELAAKAGISFEIVPAARPEGALTPFGGVPLGGEGTSYAVLHARDGASLAGRDWTSLAHATDTLVAHASRATLDEVVAALLEHGRSPDTPALALTDLGRPSQRIEVGRLADIATRARRLPGDARLLVVGEAVARRQVFAWFDRRPLFGKRVLVTRTAEQSRTMLTMLRVRGADAIAQPVIEIHPPPDPAPMQRALGRLSEDYDFVAFTSENGVGCAWDELVRQGRDARAFGKVQIAAIGPGTAAALERRGLRADIVAKEFRGESLAEGLISRAAGAAAPRILIARALVARDALPEALRAAGWQVDVVPLYETRSPAPENVANLARKLEDGAIDAVTFTSKSTVDNLCTALGDEASRLLAKLKVAAIGPITREAAEARGVRVDVMASPYTIEALVCALEASFAGAYS
ncbi:uroporphyrinogen-III synthase [Pendulispora rubella]|uniref:Uroporphyrinogen-III synthase n=1 Tax=Pendulispora rubella TaxID=2741070 RepID=A0ABZ2KXE4_9BACT